MGDWRGRTDGRRCQFVSRYRLEKCLKLPPPPPHRGRPSCSSRLETLPRRTRPQSPPIEIGGRCTRTRVRIGREGGRGRSSIDRRHFCVVRCPAAAASIYSHGGSSDHPSLAWASLRYKTCAICRARESAERTRSPPFRRRRRNLVTISED